MSEIANLVRWCLSETTQRTIWESGADMPEIDFLQDTVLDEFPCEDRASNAIEQYLLQVGAKATWPDLRPTESCACCGDDFDTTAWHKTLELSQEQGDPSQPEVIDVRCVARFCGKCAPIGSR